MHPDTAIGMTHAPVVLARGADLYHRHDTFEGPPPSGMLESMAAMTMAVARWGTR
jgi:hypothetical protein